MRRRLVVLALLVTAVLAFGRRGGAAVVSEYDNKAVLRCAASVTEDHRFLREFTRLPDGTVLATLKCKEAS